MGLEAMGSTEGMSFVTQKEVLRLAANWVRIMSVAFRANLGRL